MEKNSQSDYHGYSDNADDYFYSGEARRRFYHSLNSNSTSPSVKVQRGANVDTSALRQATIDGHRMLSFEALQRLVAHTTAPGQRPFYRTLYGLTGEDSLTLSSLAQWEVLPPVTKDALIDMPLTERSFLPLSNLDHLRTSSGTSGKPPLFSPRTRVRGMEYRLAQHDFNHAFLAFSVPLMPHWHEEFQREHGRSPRVVVYDPKHPRASVLLAEASGVDALSVFVYHITAIGEEMKRVGMNKNIRLLEVTGETCSRAQYDYMRETFPNATIVQSYNSSEVEDAHIGMPCKAMDGSEPLAVYHPKETHYLELVDPESGAVIAPKAGAEGDLLVTAYPGEPASFPLIRFRIGDTVRVVEERCPHGTWSFTVLGRTDMDFVKIPGGILRADEVARVLRTMPQVTDQFELHCSEVATPEGPRLKPLLRLTLRGTADLEVLAAEIAGALRVAPSMTYAQGVERGRYLKLTCEPLVTPPGGKTRRMVMH